MPFISVTRLRLRSIRFLPAFAVHALRSLSQVKSAPGFTAGSLLPDKGWTFWTLTAWTSQEAMRSYMTTGPHRTAMPRLMGWCDEASVVHWDQPDGTLPSWPDAERRMRESGRPSKVRFPSPNHAAMRFRPARTTGAGPISPSRR